MRKIYFQSILVWFALVVFAILNGLVRNEFYQDEMLEISAHQISSFTGIIGFLFIIYIFLKNTKAIYTKKNLFSIAFMWLLLTLIFEFSFGHFIAGHSWEKLFFDYNLLAGRLWSLVLLSIFIGPYLIGTILLKSKK